MFAIDQVEGRRIQISDAQADFHLGQTGGLQKFVVVAQQADNLPRQNTGAADAEHVFTLALEHEIGGARR